MVNRFLEKRQETFGSTEGVACVQLMVRTNVKKESVRDEGGVMYTEEEVFRPGDKDKCTKNEGR